MHVWFAAETRPFKYVIAECLADLGFSHAAFFRHKRRTTWRQKVHRFGLTIAA